MQARLTANDLACRRGERLLFRHLSLDLASGEALHVTGPNGIGKSSLLRILAGLSRPFAGKATREGRVALLDERLALDEALPLGKALDFWRGLDGTQDFMPIEKMSLTDLLDVPVRYLSTGQRKRAAMARLLGTKAAVWLLDEPLNGLDDEARVTVERLAAEHCAGGGVCVVASHQTFAVESKRVLSLSDYAS
ncbi:heme ABC exporter ATP-binding protein CcmA [Erythrobacter litoralis]|uniref:heme ABC exporter ATP-binding protein CcmA n=1 Tax=Erythrobacter litoralis TaxID=39960 RepID=UPI00243533A3|nr:heme ABC exporter ATP-binding protein CcmA [Erythrobacter litoralis]MDG6077654.1 heme ABC exporter ATP-binding protein CcmA [Erythrobacter litoralis]